MLTIFAANNSCSKFVFPLLVVALLGLSVVDVRAQGLAPANFADGHSLVREGMARETGETPKKPSDTATPKKKPMTTEEKLDALARLVEQQNERLNQLQKTISEQQETIRALAGKANVQPGTTASFDPTATATVGAATAAQPAAIAAPLKKPETRVVDGGPIKFSGDFRLRSESIFGQQNNLANGDNPAVLGNELTPRNRMRMRARLAMSGKFDMCDYDEENKVKGCDKFEWGLRLASGSFADNISTNQTLTDFFNRKPFALDQAYLIYKPKWAPRLQLQGGKFAPPWAPTEMTIDSDLMVEGFNETYTQPFDENSRLKDLTFVAWQLPFLERNSAFVRNANGTVNIDQSRRGGRDLALYGGQLRARLQPSKKVALTLSAADLYFSGTQFISPVQVFGSNLLLPLTFTIPASGTTPAQTITTQVSIPRDLLVAGNAGLGLTNASNNATNRDGRLASGYNLVDMLARLELKHKNWPVTLLANLVINTQAHGVVTAGPAGADLIIPNHENKGFWGEVQVGKTVLRGDKQFSYTFMRIQKDAVLTPFNMSDITQQSDMRGHRFQFNYAVVPGKEVGPGEKPSDPRVMFTVVGIVTERPNGLLGPFAFTPPGSLNRSTFRLQFDTVLKF
jgi:hypothetical protein